MLLDWKVVFGHAKLNSYCEDAGWGEEMLYILVYGVAQGGLTDAMDDSSLIS